MASPGNVGRGGGKIRATKKRKDRQTGPSMVPQKKGKEKGGMNRKRVKLLVGIKREGRNSIWKVNGTATLLLCIHKRRKKKGRKKRTNRSRLGWECYFEGKSVLKKAGGGKD